MLQLELADRLTESCRAVDSQSTDYALTHVADRVVVPHEPSLTPVPDAQEIKEEATESENLSRYAT